MRPVTVPRFKACRDFRLVHGVPFANFARLCITRHLVTTVKTATRAKHRTLNEARSLSAPILPGEDDGGALGDLIPGPTTLESETQVLRALDDEALWRMCAKTLVRARP